MKGEKKREKEKTRRKKKEKEKKNERKKKGKIITSKLKLCVCLWRPLGNCKHLVSTDYCVKEI